MQTKELQLVTFEQAKKLKELGFDWIKNPCYKDGELTVEPVLTRKYKGIEDICFAAPSVALALKWLRDEKGIFGYVDCDTPSGWIWQIEKINGVFICYSDNEESDKASCRGAYEEAESALLDEILSLL